MGCYIRVTLQSLLSPEKIWGKSWKYGKNDIKVKCFRVNNFKRKILISGPFLKTQKAFSKFICVVCIKGVSCNSLFYRLPETWLAKLTLIFDVVDALFMCTSWHVMAYWPLPTKITPHNGTPLILKLLNYPQFSNILLLPSTGNKQDVKLMHKLLIHHNC